MTDAHPGLGDPPPKIRVFAPLDHYVPGYRAGGPIQSISNLVEALGTEIEFSIVTRDRDPGSRAAYPGIDTDAWQRVGAAHVRYLAPGHILWSVSWLTTRPTYDVLYLNSAFSPAFSIFPLMLRRVGLVRAPSVIVAPRGEFSPGALALKRRKKRFFLACARLVGLYDGAVWQASASLEAEHITGTMGGHLLLEGRVVEASQIVVAPGVVFSSGRGEDSRKKAAGSARIVFLSRIARMKNLSTAIRLLSRLDGNVSFEIFGPIEDVAYWDECQRLIASAPSNIRIAYRGEIPHDQVHDLMNRYHLLLLPTLGENFGHVIHEALAAGCPVMVSDQTPWRGLASAGAGWDLPLEDEGAWVQALAAMADADAERFEEMSRAAVAFATGAADFSKAVEMNRLLFEVAVGPWFLSRGQLEKRGRKRPWRGSGAESAG